MSRLPDYFIFLELWPFENFGFLKLVIKISQKYVGEGIETWSADRG